VQEGAWNTLELISIGNDFLGRTQLAQQLRERINKWDYMNGRKFLPDKGVITKIHRELKTLKSPQINNPMKKWAYELNRDISKEDIQRPKNT
jgi:hypothetical protein